MVQDCADTRNYPTELAPNMLAAGRGTDGQEGSLCNRCAGQGQRRGHQM